MRNQPGKLLISDRNGIKKKREFLMLYDFYTTTLPVFNHFTLQGWQQMHTGWILMRGNKDTINFIFYVPGTGLKKRHGLVVSGMALWEFRGNIWRLYSLDIHLSLTEILPSFLMWLWWNSPAAADTKTSTYIPDQNMTEWKLPNIELQTRFS